jgi:chromosome segregation ATPase
MSADIYGLTPEERAAFDAAIRKEFKDPTSRKLRPLCPRTWAACAKLYGEKLPDAERQRDDAKARLDELVSLYAERRERVSDGVEKLTSRIKEIEAENERLRVEVTHLRVCLEGRSSAETSLLKSLERSDVKIKELEKLFSDAAYASKNTCGVVQQLEPENERLRADAARLDYISVERLILFGGYPERIVEVISPDAVGEGPDLRAAIDAAMKGGE